jgi:hypothetical protein
MQKYQKYKFRIKELMDKTVPVADVLSFKSHMAKSLNITQSRLSAMMYAKKNSTLNIPSDKMLILSNIFQVPVDDIYNYKVSADNYSGTFNLTK